MTLRAGMHMKIIAERVESASECHQLRALDCGLMQGFVFARPGPPLPVVESFP
jgi:EAL domain-containing protein (putative c-di-GMP-specific phosphodiesterase class I)